MVSLGSTFGEVQSSSNGYEPQKNPVRPYRGVRLGKVLKTNQGTPSIITVLYYNLGHNTALRSRICPNLSFCKLCVILRSRVLCGVYVLVLDTDRSATSLNAIQYRRLQGDSNTSSI